MKIRRCFTLAPFSRTSIAVTIRPKEKVEKERERETSQNVHHYAHAKG